MRLLVAEDHPTLAQSISEGLRKEGYAVDLAMRGDEALHLAQVNDYDGIVLDMIMPGATGWDIIKSLREQERMTPVLCLTARDGVEDRVRGLDAGGDDYLTKPFAWDELLARVRSVVRRGYRGNPTIIKVGDLEIDTSRKSVRRDGENIELSAREFTLIEFLGTRRDQVVSRTEIWNHLYDQNDQTTSNVVDVYIGYLRNKIDRNHDKKLIHTRRGHGYMLSAEP